MDVIDVFTLGHRLIETTLSKNSEGQENVFGIQIIEN